MRPFSKDQNDAFANITVRATNGEQMGFWCLTHREAVMTFKEYISWLRRYFPRTNDRPSAWWSARRSICSVDFAGGGVVRFVSHFSQTDGLKAWYLGDEWTIEG